MALVTKVRVLDEGVSITQGVKEMDEMDDDTGSDYGSGSGSDSYGSYSENDSSSQIELYSDCLLYTSPSPRDKRQSRMPSSA